jgi:hypothetical protein
MPENGNGTRQNVQLAGVTLSVLFSLIALGKSIFGVGGDWVRMEEHLKYIDSRMDAQDRHFDKIDDEIEKQNLSIEAMTARDRVALERQADLFAELKEALNKRRQ